MRRENRIYWKILQSNGNIPHFRNFDCIFSKVAAKSENA